MEHDGRFRLSNLASCVIVSLPNTTLVAETPRKQRQLSSAVRLRCLGLPHAGIQYSIAEWTHGQVASTLMGGASLICGLVGEKPSRDYLEFLYDSSQLAARIQLGASAYPLAALVGLGIGYWLGNRHKG
jgi:hypothetical protein